MKKAIISLLFLSLFFSCRTNRKTNSTEMAQQFPFPQTTSFTEEYTAQNCWKFIFPGRTPGYWVMFPNNIQPYNLNFMPSSVPITELICMGRFATTDSSARLDVEVYFQQLKKEQWTQPADWLSGKLAMTDHVILHKKEIVSPSGVKLPDMLTSRCGDDGSTLISRWTAARSLLTNDGDYITICARCKAEDYGELSETIRYITSQWGIVYFDRHWNDVERRWDLE